MIRSAAIAFYRSLSRYPLYTALNILGLGLGIAVFVVLSLYVRFETGYERWLPGADGIYEVRTTVSGENDRLSLYTSAGITLDEIRRIKPDVVGTRIVQDDLFVNHGNEVIEEFGQLVDPEFFRVFDLHLVAGSRATALRVDGVILSEAMARKYFGGTDVVGQTLTFREPQIDQPGKSQIANIPHAHVVTGVFQPTPANSTLKFDFVMPIIPEKAARRAYWNNWGASYTRTFFRLPQSATASAINRHMDGIVAKSGAWGPSDMTGEARDRTIELRLVRLTREHLDEKKAFGRVIGFGSVGILVLLISLINHVNLATARQSLRVQEVMLRRSVGATDIDLLRQFLVEAVILSVIAGLVGFSLVEMCLPAINRLGGLSLHLDYIRDATFLLALAAGIIGSGLIVGLYPASLLCSATSPHYLSKRRYNVDRRHAIRGALVVVQFVAVGTAFVVLCGFAAQVRHMQTSDLGFPRSGILTTWSTNTPALAPELLHVLQTRWRSVPGVRAVAQSFVPGRYFSTIARLPVTLSGTDSNRVQFNFLHLDTNLGAALEPRLLAGRIVDQRDYVPDALLPVGKLPGVISVNINAAGMRALGLPSPVTAVGRSLKLRAISMTVVGVVTDLRLDAPTEPIAPTIYVNHMSQNAEMATIVRFEGASDKVMTARLKSVWRDVVPDLPLDLMPMSEALNDYYVVDRRAANLFAFGVVMAAVIGAIGLYGMAAFSTSARATEIALRKAMGATRWQVMRLLVFQFLKPVLIANLVALPAAGFILWRWLSQFDDRVPLSPWFFIVGSSASLLIAVVTVAGLAFATASLSPGKVLRHE